MFWWSVAFMAVFRTVAPAAADVGLVAPPYEYAVVGAAAVVPEEPLDDFDELPHAEPSTTAMITSERPNLRATATSPGYGSDRCTPQRDGPSRTRMSRLRIAMRDPVRQTADRRILGAETGGPPWHSTQSRAVSSPSW